MTGPVLAILAACELCNVVGQLCFKQAMGDLWLRSRSRATLVLTAGIAIMAASFFLWLGLLPSSQLSQLFPFEALTRALILLASGFFFHEKITVKLWLGVFLISTGIFLVAIS